MSSLAEKLISFLYACGGKASLQELMRAINMSGASDAIARGFLRTVLAECEECEEMPEGGWRLKEDRRQPPLQESCPPKGRVYPQSGESGSSGGNTQSDGVEPADLPKQDTPVDALGSVRNTRTTYRTGHGSRSSSFTCPPSLTSTDSEKSLRDARFAVLFTASERRRRPRAIAAAVALVEKLQHKKTASVVLGQVRKGVFVPDGAAVSTFEGILPENVPLVLFSDATGLAPLRRTFAAVGREFVAPPVIHLENLAARLGTPMTMPIEGDEPAPLSAAATFCETAVNRLTDKFIETLETLVARGIDTVDKLLSIATPPADVVSFVGRAFDESFLTRLPTKPGVYWFVDRNGVVLYVGKAKNLSERVSSYFAGSGKTDEKLARILEKTYDVGYRVLGSELEALLEEARLIRKHRPPLNIQTEVHERTEPGTVRFRARNVILFLTAAEPNFLRVFLVSPTGYERARVKRGERSPRRLLQRVRRFFFETGTAAHTRGGNGRWETTRAPASLPAGSPAAKRADICSATESLAGRTSGKRRVQDTELEIIYSWLRRNRDTTSFIDVGKTAGYADCARLVKAYLSSPETGYAKVEMR